MKLGTEDKKKLTILAVVGTLGLGCAFYIYSQLSVPSAPKPVTVAAPAAQAPVKPPTAAVVATTSSKASGPATVSAVDLSQLDPTLKMGPMLVTESLVYSGSGRNIFSVTSVPIDIPKPIAPVR